LVERATRLRRSVRAAGKKPDDPEKEAPAATPRVSTPAQAPGSPPPPPSEKLAEKSERPEKGDKAEKADKAEKSEKAETSKKGDDAPKVDASILGDGPRPSIPPPPAAGPWRSYKEIVATLAGRIVEAQKPIRVLQSLRWEKRDRRAVHEGQGARAAEDRSVVLRRRRSGLRPESPRARSFEIIARDIDRELGEADAIGTIMTATAIEYRDVVRMLSQRGRPLFYAYSRKLYGSPKDKFPDGKSTVRDLGHVMYEILTKSTTSCSGRASSAT